MLDILGNLKEILKDVLIAEVLIGLVVRTVLMDQEDLTVLEVLAEMEAPMIPMFLELPTVLEDLMAHLVLILLVDLADPAVLAVLAVLVDNLEVYQLEYPQYSLLEHISIPK